MANSVYDLYEFYLEARDLKEKAHLVKVVSVRVDSVINPRAHKPEKKIVMRFENRRKSMILNKTQAGAMMEITGVDDYTKWLGFEVVLTAGRAGNGKDTIIITDRANSGDLDLMYPPKNPKETPIPGTGHAPFWEARSEQAVNFAAQRWGIPQAETWKRLDDAIKAEYLSDMLPEKEFKEYVEMKACAPLS